MRNGPNLSLSSILGDFIMATFTIHSTVTEAFQTHLGYKPSRMHHRGHETYVEDGNTYLEYVRITSETPDNNSVKEQYFTDGGNIFFMHRNDLSEAEINCYLDGRPVLLIGQCDEIREPSFETSIGVETTKTVKTRVGNGQSVRKVASIKRVEQKHFAAFYKIVDINENTMVLTFKAI